MFLSVGKFHQTIPAIATQSPGTHWIKRSDIDGHWVKSNMMEAVTQGFVKGYSDGRFQPNKTITHAEMITMVMQASGLPIPDKAQTGYVDNAEIPDYARSRAAAAEQC